MQSSRRNVLLERSTRPKMFFILILSVALLVSALRTLKNRTINADDVSWESGREVFSWVSRLSWAFLVVFIFFIPLTLPNTFFCLFCAHLLWTRPHWPSYIHNAGSLVALIYAESSTQHTWYVRLKVAATSSQLAPVNFCIIALPQRTFK